MSDQIEEDGMAVGQPSARYPARDEGTVNSQVMDAVSALNALAAGHAPAGSTAMLSLAATQAAALGMFNAIASQQADAAISSAAVAATCARITGMSLPNGTIAVSPPGLVAAAEVQAQTGILILKTQAAQAGGDSQAASAALERLAAAAASPLADATVAESNSGTSASESSSGNETNSRPARPRAKDGQ